MKTPILIFTLLIILGVIVGLVVKQMSEHKEETNHISATEMMNEKKNFTESDAKKAILTIEKEYGKDMAKIVEKMMRLETAHFKSGQYKLTGSAGMEVGKWPNIPPGATAGFITMSDADKTDGDDNFIVWNSVTDFARYLAEYIKRYKGNFARWNTTNPTAQKVYAQHVNEIKNRFVV